MDQKQTGKKGFECPQLTYSLTNATKPCQGLASIEWHFRCKIFDHFWEKFDQFGQMHNYGEDLIALF